MEFENFSWITDQLAVGEAPTEKKFREFADEGITAVIDLRSEAADDEKFLNKLGMTFLHVDIEDTDIPTMDQLMLIFDFANPLLDRGEKILVHCQNGYGRSPLIIAAILIRQGMTTEDALNTLFEAHRVTTFTTRQEIFIRGLERQLNNLGTHAR
jgi:protein-tyrosine phosphatase